MKVNRITIVKTKEEIKGLVTAFRKALEKQIKLTDKNPDAVIVLGGHGTLFVAEKKFPGVPKLFLRHEEKRYRLKRFQQEVTNKLKKGKFKIVKLTKLEAKVNGKKKLLAINDINIHYNPPTALRFILSVNRKKTPEIIGDGLVISTPYGSTAYFSSITGKKFSRGIGIAFNNTTKKQKSRIFGKDPKIKVKITRGPGNISYDSSKDIVNLKKGDVIEISVSKDIGRLVEI